MEVSYLGQDKYNLKTKTGSVQLTPGQLTLVHKKEGADFVVNGPGEYEIEGMSVFGFQIGKRVVYVVQADEIRVLYLGELDPGLGEQIAEKIENVDVVVVNCREQEGMGVQEAVKLIAKLEPYYVIPGGNEREEFVKHYEHGSRLVKTLPLSRLAMPEDVTEVIVFE